MKKILGLDLGVGAHGWAVVLEANDPISTLPAELSDIVKTGVRRISLSPNERKSFDKGETCTTNAERRKNRGMRRNLQRYKLRRAALKDVLIKSGIINDGTLFSENGNHTTFQTYKLRASAVSEMISLEEFARVLIMINKKRGYRSNRKDKFAAKNESEDKNKSASEKMGHAISGMELAERMYDEGLTPGAICLEILQKGRKKLPEFYKSDLTAEFDRIWAKQAEFYPSVLTEELKRNVIGKSARQTDTTLSKNFEWTTTEKRWNPDTAQHEPAEITHKIEGLKRNPKDLNQKIENYQWRVSAIEEKIDPEKLIVVLKDLNSQIEHSSGLLGEISDRSKELAMNHITVGQYLWKSLCENPDKSIKKLIFYRQDYLDEFNAIWECQAKFHPELTSDLKEQIRDVIIFYQRKLKSQKGRISICELEQFEKPITRNGKTVIKTVGHKVIPCSHPLYQTFRIWQTLNNIKVISANTGTGQKKKRESYSRDSRNLTLDEMNILASELQVKDSLTKKEIISLLFDGRKDIDLNFDKVIGNQTRSAMFRLFSEMIESCGYEAVNFDLKASDIHRYLENTFSALKWDTGLLELTDFDDIKALESTSQYRLWHLLYSYEGDNSLNGDGKLVEKLSQWFNIPLEYSQMMANLTFEQDYGRLSAKAISRILPFLKEGNAYDVACLYAGYNHSKDSLTKEENETRQLKRHLEPIPKNSLNNPVVEKALNQMVNLVNQLADTYGNEGKNGPFDEIRIELARELKKSKKERKKLSTALAANETNNATIREIIKQEFGKSHVSKNDIIRYKLYMELAPNGFHTLYSNTYIRKEELFTNKFEIEHIIPKARLFDDSLSNKTLETCAVNKDKDKDTAWDYVRNRYGEEGLTAYEARCNLVYKGRKAKLRKLMMTASEIPDGFIDRDLRNTQYITKKALSMLKGICRSVVVTTGSLTDVLRQEWQLVDILKELTLPKYEAAGLVKVTTDGEKVYKEIEGWSKRNDHRHHAMDALTVAFTRPALIQFYNHRNAHHDESKKNHSEIFAIARKYFRNGHPIPPMPLSKLRAEVKRHLTEILISTKAKNKVTTQNVNKIKTKEGVVTQVTPTPRGSLSQDTFYGERKRYVTKHETVDGKFDAEKISTVSKANIREALMKRLMQFGGDPKKAFTGKNSPEKNPIPMVGREGIFVPLKVKTVYVESYRTQRQKIDDGLSIDKVVDNGVKETLLRRLEQYGGDSKKAFANLEENPIIHNVKPIKKVTISARAATGKCLHYKRDKDGNHILDTDGNKISVDFVVYGGNHHAAIYRRPKLDKTGEICYNTKGEIIYEWKDEIVPFVKAVDRKNAGSPVVDKEWGADEGWEFVFTLKKDEYFVFPNERTGFDPKKVDLLDPNSFKDISENLYSVQQISSSIYYFRHHLDTQVNFNNSLRNITWKRFSKVSDMKDIVKVRINHIGEIVQIGEY